MKWFGYCLALLTLSSCGMRTESHETISNGAIDQVTAIEQGLPKECATESIKTQIKAVKTQITAISQACELEKTEVKAEKIKWMTAFFGLLLAIVVFVIRKVVK